MSAYPLTQFPYLIEATIQIFEYTYELTWKLLKKICREEGIEVKSPREAFQQAYRLNLIFDEQTWLAIIEDRNLTLHTYQHATAKTIYEHCKVYLPVMQKTLRAIEERYQL